MQPVGNICTFSIAEAMHEACRTLLLHVRELQRVNERDVRPRLGLRFCTT